MTPRRRSEPRPPLPPARSRSLRPRGAGRELGRDDAWQTPETRRNPMTDVLLSERAAEHVQLLTLNRPERLNAMTSELCEALHDELERIAADRSCRAIVLTGAGRGFCAGLDLGGYGEAPGSDGSD